VCLACGKALPDRAKLAQHLKDAHAGVNSPPKHNAPPAGRRSAPSSGFSLADVLEAKMRRAAEAKRPASPSKKPPPSPPPKPRGVQGTLKVAGQALSNSLPCTHQICCQGSRAGLL
jgi:hypothetical protein